MAFGEGISVTDLFQLLNSIKEKQGLVLEVKVLEEPWAAISVPIIRNMVNAIKSDKIHGGQDIRLRLHKPDKT